jgi:hypothetical protein
MSNVAVIERKPQLVAGNTPAPIVPTNIEQVWRFAEMVAKSGMSPKGMERPETITVAIMHGLEIGLTPLMALQRIAVVNGRPTIWGDAAMGLVRASGRAEYVRESIRGEGEQMVAVCTVKRRDESEPHTSEFSVADAKKASLWGKAGPWQQYPKRMLQMRARAFALRDTFADVLGGLYLREEMEGVGNGNGHSDMRDVTPRDEPPAPPPIETEVIEPQKDEPPAATVQKVGIPDGKDNPEAFLKWVDEVLGAVEQPDALGDAWNEKIEVRCSDLLPPDYEEAMNIYRRHERRLAP